MISTCMLHNNNTCGKRQSIASYQKLNQISISYAYEWNTNTDNIGLITELIEEVIGKFKSIFPKNRINFRKLSGKDGNIYCGICRQIQESDIVICDISKNNPNVFFELGSAIASGARIFMLRSRHYKRPKKTFQTLLEI
jgi:hypothetical protein